MGGDNGQAQQLSREQLQRRPTLLPVVEARRSATPPPPVVEGGPSATPPPPVETGDLFEAFQAAYERMRTSGKFLFGASVNVHAIVDVLVRKGVITQEEINDSRTAVQDDVQNAYVEAGLGVKLAIEARDKYELPADELPEIDCERRIPLCRAACCTFRWALSEQDVVEGVVQWDLTNPYVNRVADDGYCVHCDAGTRGCTIYDNRPGICRTYDCRQDPRIWQDFDNRVINPGLYDTLAEKGREPVPVQQWS